MNESPDNKSLKVSKSQRKREIDIFRHQAQDLVGLAVKEIEKLNDKALIESVLMAKKIPSGSARKRQIQHITKLIKGMSPEAIKKIVELADPGPANSNFHQLETWRDKLLTNTSNAMSEISSIYPQMDRQALRHLVKQAIREQEQGSGSPVYYRKIFQFLKSLSDEMV